MEISSPTLDIEVNQMQQEQEVQTFVEGTFFVLLFTPLVPSMATPISENRDKQSPEKATDNNPKVGNSSSL